MQKTRVVRARSHGDATSFWSHLGMSDPWIVQRNTTAGLHVRWQWTSLSDDPIRLSLALYARRWVPSLRRSYAQRVVADAVHSSWHLGDSIVHRVL
jgi:hypothetical protein